MNEKPKIRKSLIIWDVIGPFVMFMLYMVIASLAVLIIGGLVTGVRDSSLILRAYPSLSLWVNVAFYAAAIIFQGRVYKKDDQRFGERKLLWSPFKATAAVVIGVAVSIVLNLLISLSHLHEIFPSYDEGAAISFQGQNAVLLIIATVILGPLAEEIIFRGLVFSRMRLYLGLIPCMIISSVLFGLYHMNMVQFIYTTLVGLFLSYVYEKSGSLIVPVLAHGAMNLVALQTYF